MERIVHAPDEFTNKVTITMPTGPTEGDWLLFPDGTVKVYVNGEWLPDLPPDGHLSRLDAPNGSPGHKGIY